MTSFFSSIIGGPFSTPVGQLIEKATDVGQVSEDWSLYMEICDQVNASEDGPKDAIKAIKKQLSNNIGKNSVVILYTLTVLETCVKNCGKRFHIQVTQKDFLQELIRVISPKGNPPQVVVDKVLSLLQTWADAFQGSDDLMEVERICNELKEKGMEFPLTDLDQAAPIHTPARSMPLIEPSSPLKQELLAPEMIPGSMIPGSMIPGSMIPGSMIPGSMIPGSEQRIAPVVLAVEAENLAKLRSELDVVQHNCKVMGEMLTELTPGQEPLEDDWQLLTELNSICHQMQKRVVELVQQVESEEVTCELLVINDDLNNVLLRYERYERLRGGQGQNTTTTSSTPPPGYETLLKGTENSDNGAEAGTLIDFGDANSLLPLKAQSPGKSGDDFASIAALNISDNSTTKETNDVLPSSDGQGNDQVDVFAQSRQALRDDTCDRQSDDQTVSGLGAEVALKSKTNPYATEAEAGEMEQWLTEAKDSTQPSATSSEFDQFLATHAPAESERLLDVTSPSNQESSNRGSGTLPNNGDDTGALFTL